MASWLGRSASVAFVLTAALLCRSVAGDLDVTGATDSCLLTVNLSRTGRINERLPVLTKDPALETTVIQSMKDNQLGGSDTNCTVSGDATPTNEKVKGFVGLVPHNTPFNCPSVISEAVKNGLNGLADYNEQPWDGGKSAPYNTPAVQSLVYLLNSKGSGVGCGVTTGCTSGQVLLVCRVNPLPGEEAPFSKKFFDALKERDAKNVDLTKLTQSDINTDLEGKPAAPSSAFLAVPGAIPTAALTFSSLLGFASSIHQ